jgi:hypothetical protein
MNIASDPYFFYLLVFAVAAAGLSAIWILVQSANFMAKM